MNTTKRICVKCFQYKARVKPYNARKMADATKFMCLACHKKFAIERTKHTEKVLNKWAQELREYHEMKA